MTGIICSAISALQTLWYIPFIKKNMGNESYGYIALVNNTINTFTVITLALTSMSTKNIAIELERDNYKEANKYFNSVFFALLFIASNIVVFGIGISMKAESLFNISNSYILQVRSLFLISTFTFFFQIIATPFLGSVYYKNNIYINYLFNIADYCGRILLTICLFGLGIRRIWTAAAATLMVNMLSISVYIFYTKRVTPFLVISKSYVHLQAVRNMISSGIWVSLTKVGSILLDSINTIIANWICGPIMTSIYATISQLETMVVVMLHVLISCFLPGLYKCYGEYCKDRIFEYTVESMKTIGYVTGILVGGIIVFGKVFIQLWLGNDYLQYFYMLVLSVIYLPLSLPCEMINQVCITENKIKEPAIATIILGVANIILIYIFSGILHNGIMGILISKIIILTIRGVLYYTYYFFQIMGIKNWNILYCYVVSVASMFMTMLCGIVILGMTKPKSWMGLIIAGTVTVVSYICIMSLISNDFRKRFIIGKGKYEGDNCL